MYITEVLWETREDNILTINRKTVDPRIYFSVVHADDTGSKEDIEEVLLPKKYE